MPGDRERTAVVTGECDLAILEEVLDALDRLWDEAPPGADEHRYLFALAVSEILTNVIQHNPGPSFALRVELGMGGDALHATIDDGAPPAEVAIEGAGMPDVDSESGRGLALAEAVLDELRHERTASGNRWTLRRGL
ncbi:ATP-binding protein [Tessaracoccus oleiagri]|uniref:Serine/threonine-protein kinase RsbW n=1 Tax=Tessaracoccus oleiagri TaxID=686624 RepID=A0A1G9JY46_9ACTN|nr:ATP-binding protein [Tessaracoccus oleiagri]SDL42469.1 serine/threonine-protein kinase RsbW [Tessaracoccus oleiagri]